MYGKIFTQIYDGSLYGHWEALITFQQMIVLADRNGVVDMTPQALSARTSIPLSIITTGITGLEMPDPDSRTPDAEGRRIVPLSDARPWGWHITNYDHYRKIRSAEERRDYMRSYQRDRRSKLASTESDPVNPDVNNVNPVNPPSTILTNSSKQYAVSSKQKDQKQGDVGKIGVPTYAAEDLLGFDLFWSEYPKRPGASKPDSLKAWMARIREGTEADTMIEGAKAYRAYVEHEGTQPKHIKLPETFLGPGRHFSSDWTPTRTNGQSPKPTQKPYDHYSPNPPHLEEF